MQKGQDYYQQCSEALIVNLARTGDLSAFEELVRRRQSSVRNLMRRFCSDTMLAEDLAQQVFLKVWQGIQQLKQAKAFGGWLKRIAVTIWLQHLRKNDALHDSEELNDETMDITSNRQSSTSVGMDLDRALATLPDTVRLCVVLSYNEGMSHSEITEVTGLPLGTVKSHINRGAKRLQQMLSAYKESATTENSK